MNSGKEPLLVGIFGGQWNWLHIPGVVQWSLHSIELFHIVSIFSSVRHH